MQFDPSPHHRRSVRLSGFDYANAGAYFVTLVTQKRSCLLSRIIAGLVEPTGIGQVAEAEWIATTRMRRVELGSYVLMPNHLHGILIIKEVERPIGASSDRPDKISHMRASGPQIASLGALIGGYKAAVTKRCRQIGALPEAGTLWQRNYYEHFIRNDEDWNAIDEYIADNPRRWAEDSENPNRASR